MVYSDLIKIAVGALLGFLISELKTLLEFLRRRERARHMLRTEMSKIRTFISSASRSKETIPAFSLPNVSMLLNPDDLHALGKLGSITYQLHDSICRAEEVAKQASKLIEDQQQYSSQYKFNNEVYAMYIDKIQEYVTQIDKLLR
jgi:hypothetical protein